MDAGIIVAIAVGYLATAGLVASLINDNLIRLPGRVLKVFALVLAPLTLGVGIMAFIGFVLLAVGKELVTSVGEATRKR